MSLKEELLDILKDLKDLRRDINLEDVKRIAKINLRERAEKIGSKWHSEIKDQLFATSTLSEDVIEKYDVGFTRLIELSSPNNSKKNYLQTLDVLLRPLQADFIIPAKKGLFDKVTRSDFERFFGSISNEEENEYLAESVACAQSGYYRAAVVLGWCAAIDRLHLKIEDIGFAEFNIISARMASYKKGRFKRFNQVQNINNLSELRMTFDSIILWIIEGMELIDSNQHTRLKSCFDMRSQCAHPGDAPITKYNLLSFFSDIDNIILKNPKFIVNKNNHILDRH